MRISDWSSDGCSSDLMDPGGGEASAYLAAVASDLRGAAFVFAASELMHGQAEKLALDRIDPGLAALLQIGQLVDVMGDRKSVVSGKSVSVRVDLGGRRIIQNKKKEKIAKIQEN